MARDYKALTAHAPIDYQDDLDAVSSYFEGKDNEFLFIFERWNLRRREYDDVEALIDRVTQRLVQFALECDALPLRTPRKLRATVQAIARHPADFLANVGRYDPEAVALVYAAFTKGSPQNRLLLSSFEADRGAAPPAEAIAQAASVVLVDLEEQISKTDHVGGQTLVLQRNLVRDLASIFVNSGGSLKRSTRFHSAGEEFSYHGPFHDFLELVLPPVRTFARKAGFRMESTRSLITIPKKDDQREEETQQSIFGTYDEMEPERTPARVGNFFELHRRRLKKRRVYSGLGRHRPLRVS